MRIANAISPEGQRRAGFDHGLGSDDARFQRRGGGQHLEGRAELVAAQRGPIEARVQLGWTVIGLRLEVRIEVRQRDHGVKLAGLHIHQDGGRALGTETLHAGRQHVAKRRLDGEVDRQLQGRADLCRVAQACVEVALDPARARQFSEADILGGRLDAADEVRGGAPGRIDTHDARAKFQTGITEIQHRLALARGDRALDPGEPRLA